MNRSTDAEDEDVLFAEQREQLEWPILKLFTEYGRVYGRYVTIGLGATLVGPLLGLVPGYILGFAIDAVLTGERAYTLPLIPGAWLPSDPVDQLLLSFAIIVAALILQPSCSAISTAEWNLFTYNVQHDVRTEAYGKLQRLGVGFFTEQRTGQLMSIVNDDVNRLHQFMSNWLAALIRTSLRVVGIAVIMLALNWQLAIFSLLPIPIIVGMSYVFRDRIAPKYAEVRSTVGALNARIENNLGGIEVVKSFTAEEFENERVEEASRDYFDASWDAAKTWITYFPSLQTVNGLGFAFVFLVGGYWVVAGPPLFFGEPLRTGTFVTFVYYIGMLRGPMNQAGSLLNQYEESRASVLRILALMAYPVSVPERDDAIELPAVTGRVEYDDVSFGYGENEPVLQSVSFDAEPGDTVGIVGPTGSGKTTMMKLLLRLYDVDEGAVRLDGHDVRDLTLESLRDAIGYVSQEPFLFHGTVAENIAYGRGPPGTVDREEIEDAARIAGAHEFVVGFADGYDAQIGERGVTLSGGQRQRIAIARTILKEPDLLVLDEATSHVDNETEVLIQDGLERLTADSTTFAIAHRLSTIRDADRILVVEDGVIVERGTHEELLELNGLYANLWGVQVGELDALPDDFGGWTERARD